MKCSICGIRIDSVEEAVEAGWTPSFFDGDQEHEVACRSCTETLLQIGEDGEWEVKEKFGGKIKFLEERRAAKTTF